MPVRNEDWILGLSARAVLMAVDELVVLDHASTDNTAAILADLVTEYPDRVTVLAEPESVWEEMRHRQRLLDAARRRGATHIVMIDADEILTGNLLPDIRAIIANSPICSIVQLPWLCLRDSIDRVHLDGVWGEASVSVAFRDSPELHWSSGERGGYDFHHRHPMGATYRSHCVMGETRQSGLMHLQFVSARRLRAKQFLYCLTERLRWPGRESAEQVRAKYSLAVYGTREKRPPQFRMGVVPGAWWAPYADLMRFFQPDAEPWQAAECRRILAEHPGLAEGLDDFSFDAEAL